MKRVFAAVKIEPQQALLGFISELRQRLAAESIKWVEEENLHLTLKFFGETQEEKIQKIEKVFQNINTAPFDLIIGNLKIFGSRYHPRVIWLEAGNNEPFKSLSDMVNEQIKPLGYFTDRQNFVPHLTIGRIKSISDKKYFQQVIDSLAGKTLQTQYVNCFYLYESILHPSGPEYKLIHSYNIDRGG